MDATPVATPGDNVMSWTALVAAPISWSALVVAPWDKRQRRLRWSSCQETTSSLGPRWSLRWGTWGRGCCAGRHARGQRHVFYRAGLRAGGRGATTSSPGPRWSPRRGTWGLGCCAGRHARGRRHVLDCAGRRAGGRGATTSLLRPRSSPRRGTRDRGCCAARRAGGQRHLLDRAGRGARGRRATASSPGPRSSPRQGARGRGRQRPLLDPDHRRVRVCPDHPCSCLVIRRAHQPYSFAVFLFSPFRPRPGIPSLDEFRWCLHAAQYKASFGAFEANA